MSLDLGPCQVLFGTAEAEIDIGKTQGGVRVSFVEDFADLMSDQFGTQPEDQVITGHSATIVIPLAEYTHDNFATALNQTKLLSGEKTGIKGSGLLGVKLSHKAQSLLLKKYVSGVVSTDSQDWIRFPKAGPTGSIEVVFDGATQRILETTMRAIPDDSDVLYYIGDEDAANFGV